MKKWVRPLGLLWWQIDIYYNSNPKDFKQKRGFEEIALVSSQWQYLTARVEWNLELVAKQSDGQLETVLLHELAHILVNEMREPDKDHKHEERVCELLSRAFLWVSEDR